MKLDVDKFKKDEESDEVKSRIIADVLLGNKAAVNATPTFYLNGNKLDSFSSFDEFKKILSSL